MKEWYKKLVAALSKPEAERQAALLALETPPDDAPGASGTTAVTGTNSELAEIIKAQTQQIKLLTTELSSLKKAQDDQQAALTEQAKKQVQAKVAAKIEDAQKQGRIAIKDETAQKFWEARLTEDFDTAAQMLDKIPSKTSSKSDGAKSTPPNGDTSNVQKMVTVGDYRKAAQAAFTQSN